MMQQTEIELVAWQAGGLSQSFVVKSDQSVLIGKSRNCGLQLSGHDVSDIHCRIGFEEGQLWIQDWMSATGTKVNGEPVIAKTYVGRGSIVEIGGYRIQVSRADSAGNETQRSGAGENHGPQPPADDTHSVPLASHSFRPQFSALPGSAEEKNESFSKALKMTNEQLPAEQHRSAHQSALGDALQPCVRATSKVELLSQDDEIYDRETVELLLAELEDLRATLAQSDSQQASVTESVPSVSADAEKSDRVLQRIQELSEEANRADERVLILEEMLHAAEDANRSEVEERAHLEAWIGDIEKRVGQRESEHAAEVDALRERLDSADIQNNGLQRKLQQVATNGDSAQQRSEDMMENLQQENRQLQDTLADVKKDLRQLKQKFENQSEQSEAALREDRAKIAREHADMSRLKFEYAQKLRELEELPKSSSQADPSLQGLREHREYLREMSKEKREQEQSSLSLADRLKRLWNRVD